MAQGQTSSNEWECAVRLGPLGWIGLLGRALFVTIVLILKIIKAAFGGSKGGYPLYEYMMYEGIRTYQLGIPAIDIQNLLASSSKTCMKVAKKKKIPAKKFKLRDGTVVVRLGDGGSGKVRVLFHGGGYAAPILPSHVDLACGFEDSLPRNTSIFILQYALASEKGHRYPLQLEQAALLMEHILHTEKIHPSAITMIGDSAGAHLTLSLLLHLQHPNPKVTPVSMDGRLAGAFISCPWIVNMNLDCESMRKNEGKDLLNATALAYWTRNFMGDAEPDYWNSLLTVPAKWWGDLPADDILISCGEDEVLLDGTLEFCRAIQSAHPRAKLRTFPNEIHGHMLMNRFLRINKPCASEGVYRDWLAGRLSGERKASEQ